MQLVVHGLLRVDGRLSADGSPRLAGASGGGSGGSLWLTVSNLAGSGSISANGGAGGSFGGGGGGGRIALYYGENDFAGTLSAHGGMGAAVGGAGTIYLAPVGSASGQLFVDNGGWRGTNTPVVMTSFLDLLSVSGGAVVASFGLSVNSLVLRSNAWITTMTTPGGIQFGVVGDASIQSDSGFQLNGKGYGPGQGPGHGATGPGNQLAGGGGGGYGGCGGMGLPNILGGNAYGSPLLPSDWGSGAGLGGAGGGTLRLVVGRNLLLDGSLSAEGGSALSEGGGGGSGGSILLQVGKLSGNGFISADGGWGDYPQGGGGGGGRIAVHCGTNGFAGTMSALGGFGAVSGGAGTIYFKSSDQPVGRLLVDNGGAWGTNTALSTPEAFDLKVSGGAVVHPFGDPLVVSSLRLDSGTRMTHLTAQSNLDLTVLGDAVVSSNSAIAVDGAGYAAYITGPGSGLMPAGSSGSGAGYGGAGGASAAGTPGGVTYGSAEEPIDRGSCGGMNPNTPGFCQGGGALRLRVGGTLLVDGRLGANGNAALLESAGGGSGGSIWVTARNLEGGGAIEADGGSGELFEGGGGGGGRIALYSVSNLLAGPIHASGGFGASPGDKGTLFLSGVPRGQVLGQSPSNVVTYAVSAVDLFLSSPLDPSSTSPAAVFLDSPNGPLPPGSVTPSTPDLTTLHLDFPPQTALGYYQIRLGSPLTDLYGLSITYTGSFVITAPIISGHVTDEQGLPVAYATLRPDGGLLPALTDSAGSFALEVTPSWSGTLTPSKDSFLFIPDTRGYTNVTSSLTNQNFVMVSPAHLTMTAQQQGANLHFNWYGISGVTYQLFQSSDLVEWVPYGQPLPGTNGPVALDVPIDATPPQFFRFGTALELGP